MDYLFKYMLLSFSLCCARTIQASRDDSSRHNDCDLMCGDRRCFSDRIPELCVCPKNFVERDGVCWEVAQPQDRVQDSKNEDSIWNIDGELDAIREETHHNKDAGSKSHHGHHPVNHEGHAHQHEDKLKHVKNMARTLPPPAREHAVPQSDVPPEMEPSRPKFQENYHNRDENNPLREHNNEEFEVPHIPPKEYHIKPKPHHKHKGKHQNEAKTVEVAYIGEEEGKASQEGKLANENARNFKPANENTGNFKPANENTGNDKKPANEETASPAHTEGQGGEANVHGKAAAVVQQAPDERQGKMRDVASMADVYFLAQNVPKQFHVLDSNKEQIKDIQLQVKEENHSSDPQAAPHANPKGDSSSSSQSTDAGISKLLFVAVVAGCSVAGLMGLVVAGVCWYRLQKNVKAASEAEYPAYGVTGPAHEKAGSPGDRKLAQSAQMYHYQHQKQQMLAMERAQGELGGNGSDVDSEEEEEGADYTVYECPGLAPTGEMEVKNPLFSDDTPVGPGGSNNEESTQHKQ